MNERSLRSDAELIWRAGVAAVDSARLVQSVVTRAGDQIEICGHQFSRREIGQIAVVGGGKAGAGMAAGLEEALGRDIVDAQLSGWVNVPADCVRPLRRIHLHAARPAALNEPTEAGVAGARRILEIVAQLSANDLCLVLISGGGSALLPAPVPDISLADKQAVTRLLMRGGATIQELNTVRKQLSRIKGGGLARASTAGTTIALVISDIVGDPLDLIASGPTMEDASTADEALAVLRRYAREGMDAPVAVVKYLESKAAEAVRTRLGAASNFVRTGGLRPPARQDGNRRVFNHVIGNNRVALDAAAGKARELGYAVHSLGSENQGEARDVGRALATFCRDIREQGQPIVPPVCVLSGGEPVVHLATTDQPRKGGRNQELVLAAVEHLWADGMAGMAILSGGTDGEDGPTDAAGAVADAATLAQAKQQGLSPGPFLEINNSYPFFEATGGLLKTGPTHTNVMDLRVAVVGERGASAP